MYAYAKFKWHEIIIFWTLDQFTFIDVHRIQFISQHFDDMKPFILEHFSISTIHIPFLSQRFQRAICIHF